MKVHDVKPGPPRPGTRAVVVDTSDPATKKRLSTCAREVYYVLRKHCNWGESIHVLRVLIDVIAKHHLGGTYEGTIELGEEESKGGD